MMKRCVYKVCSVVSFCKLNVDTGIEGVSDQSIIAVRRRDEGTVSGVWI